MELWVWVAITLSSSCKMVKIPRDHSLLKLYIKQVSSTLTNSLFTSSRLKKTLGWTSVSLTQDTLGLGVKLSRCNYSRKTSIGEDTIRESQSATSIITRSFTQRMNNTECISRAPHCTLSLTQGPRLSTFQFSTMNLLFSNSSIMRVSLTGFTKMAPLTQPV